MRMLSEDQRAWSIVLRRVTIAVLTICCVACDAQEAAASGRTGGVYRSDPAASARTSGRVRYGFNGVPYLAQWAKPWGTMRYGDDARCTTFATGGCGPTAIAMVLRHYGIGVNPLDIGELAVSYGARKCPGGTDAANEAFLDALARQYRLDVTRFHYGHDRILGNLRERRPVIAVGAVSGYTAHHRPKSYEGHFLVLTGVDQLRTRRRTQTIIRVNDPGKPERKGIAYMTLDQFRHVHRFFSFLPAASDDVRVAVAAGEDQFDDSAARRSVVQADEHRVGCDRVDQLRQWQPQVVSRTLGTSTWVAYGRTLAACGPEHRPWDAIGAGDREQFVDDYVVPFVNGDVLLGSPFQRQARTHHGRIMRAWGLEGG
ncbi:MAG: C39 family peptidase, partial [bacterium]|nr:C39 family peptidase [bacterium]